MNPQKVVSLYRLTRQLLEVFAFAGSGNELAWVLSVQQSSAEAGAQRRTLSRRKVFNAC